jgi:hypothetical protein
MNEILQEFMESWFPFLVSSPVLAISSVHASTISSLVGEIQTSC